MRLHLIGLICLLLLLHACTEDKQQHTTPSAPVENTSPTTPATETPTATPAKSQTKEESTEAPAQQQSDKASQTKEASATADYPTQEGLALAKTSGCLACHAIDKKVVGPAWKDVAKRYAGDSGAKAKLIEKVAKGGRGNWTEIVGNMAMPPYSPRVSAENIEALVDFVLALNND